MYRTLNELRDLAYAQSVRTGWHEDNLSNDHFKCLIITELCEAVQADRSMSRAQLMCYRENIKIKQPRPETHRKFCFETFIKDTVEDELADAAIRCFDFAGNAKIDLQYNNCYDYLISQDKTFTENIYAIIREFCNPAWSIDQHVTIALSQIYKLAEVMGIDLKTFVELKMEYNKHRPYMHGGKKY